MPRYFFNVRSADDFAVDDQGIDLPDIEAVIREADLSAREMLANALHGSGVIDGQTFEITDESGVVVFQHRFRDSLKAS